MEANARTWLGRISRSPYIFPLAVIATLAFLLLSEHAYLRASRDVAALRQQVDARAALQSVLLCVSEAESGEQGYWLTGRAPEPGHPPVCQKDFEGWWAQVTEAFETQPHWQGDVARLRQLLDRRDPRAAPGGPDLRAEATRGLSARLFEQQTHSVQAARRDLAHVLSLHRVGVVAMAITSLLALTVMLRQTHALSQQREERRRAVQAERDQLEQLVHQRTEELTELTRHLEWVAEEARARLAGALHDDLGALLTTAKLDAARLKARLGPADGEVAARLAHLTGTLNEVINMKRRLIEELWPSSLQHLGLVPALEGLLAEVRRRSGLVVEATLVRVPLAPDVALTAYRLVQEALENVERHAAAERVWVRLQPDGAGMARIEVQDDGRGFDPAERRAAWHGLVGLRYRVQAAHGIWLLHAAPGEGTCVGAVLPLVDTPLPAERDIPCQAAPTGVLAQH